MNGRNITIHPSSANIAGMHRPGTAVPIGNRIVRAAKDAGRTISGATGTPAQLVEAELAV
jgi:hypothetical protein